MEDTVLNIAPEELELMQAEFKKVFGEPPLEFIALKPHASDRRLFKVHGKSHSAVAAFNPSQPENDTFVYLTGHFAKLGLSVPEIYTYLPDRSFILERDLGDITLLDALLDRRSEDSPFPDDVRFLYQSALENLAKFQIVAGKSLDFTKCAVNPVSAGKMFARDIVAFKEQFLSRACPNTPISQIDGECSQLCEFVETVPATYFLYRDFQSRNIMITGKDLTFIDYQGGTRGPLQYDVVSILYQASARIPEADRDDLVHHYIKSASQHIVINADEFLAFFRAFIALRMMQVLGVYGRQGLGAGKTYFRNSIPIALVTLEDTLVNPDFPVEMPKLLSLVSDLREMYESLIPSPPHTNSTN